MDANSIIHPYAKIHAWAGEVRIGKGCIISERVILGTEAEGGDLKDENDIRSGGGSRNEDSDIDLGCNVVLESGVVVKEGCRIGDMSIVDVEGRLGTGCVVGRVSADSNDVLYFSFGWFGNGIQAFKHQVLRLAMRVMKPSFYYIAPVIIA